MSNIATSNETDLDWLARNVHVWNETAYAAMCGGVERVLWISGAAYGQEVEFKNAVIKDQWLARRAELQNKPSWEDAPEWAQWLAKDSPDKDEESAWWWYADKPVAMKNTWQVSTEGRARMASSCHCDLGDWRDTLEKRPEEFKPSIEEANRLAQEFKPFISIEDNQEQEMTHQQEVKQDNGWFERGELPPVGTRVNVSGAGLVYGDGEKDCEVLAHVEDTAVVRMSYGLGCFQAHVMSPSMTERELAIEEMCNVAGLDGLVFGLVAGKLYDAGYRKGSK